MQAGLDSLGAIELRNAVAATFAITLPVTAAFDFPTVTALAQHIGTLLSVPTSAASRSHPSLSSAAARASLPTGRARRQPHASAARPNQTEVAETARPNIEALQTMIAHHVRDILGVPVELNQPLMEVSSWPRLFLA